MQPIDVDLDNDNKEVKRVEVALEELGLITTLLMGDMDPNLWVDRLGKNIPRSTWVSATRSPAPVDPNPQVHR